MSRLRAGDAAGRRAALRSARARRDFVEAAVHELRTPLSHIKGFVSSLRQRDVEWDEATRADFLAEIARETDRLASLIDDLLDVSRLERGGLDRATVRPAVLVAEGLDRARGGLGDHPVAVAVPEDLPSVDVDRAQLERVLANLLANAAKYSPPGTPITISAAVAPEARLELIVEDGGPGIPPYLLDRVFDQFVRAPTPAERPVAGTGLGLWIARSIVRAHGGRIRAENRTEGGARLVITLPLARSDGASAAPPLVEPRIPMATR